MARVVEGLPPARPTGRPAKYPWDEWLDGRAWLLDPATDFPAVTRVEHFRIMAGKAARNRDKRLSFRVHPEGVYIQAVPR